MNIASPAEVAEWQEVEAAVWPGSLMELVPSHLLHTHRRYGGLLLGAREPGGRLIAILLGFPGLKDGRVIHCSHLLGVRPEWQSRDLGFKMKCRQRTLVLAQGLDLVVWTFDPLETRNARLNIGRLGGLCHEYHPNLYGEMSDGLNAGLETDRLTVSWYLRRDDVAARLAGVTDSPDPARLRADGVPLLTRTSLRRAADGTTLVLLDEILPALDAPTMLVEAPMAFQTLKAADLGAALAWRLGLRVLFLDLFGRGYSVLDFPRETPPEGPARCYYLIGKDNRITERTEDERTRIYDVTPGQTSLW